MRFGGKDERQYGGLCRMLSRRDRLSVGVNRGPQRGMSQQFLHDFEFCPYAPEQSRVVCRNVCQPIRFLIPSLSAPGRIIRRRIACPQYGWRPRWCSLAKSPVIRFATLAPISPVNESRGENRMNRNRLLRCLGLASTYDAISYRTRHVHGALGKIDVAPLECEQLTLTQPG